MSKKDSIRTKLQAVLKKASRPEKFIYVIAVLEVVVFLSGVPWLFADSLVAALAAFIWMALVPLVVITVLASFYVIQDISKANSLTRVIVLFNWLALAFLIGNVAS